MENRYNSIEDAENRNPIPPFVNAINSNGDLMAVPNPAYDNARYSEERWREAGRREMNTALRDEIRVIPIPPERLVNPRSPRSLVDEASDVPDYPAPPVERHQRGHPTANNDPHVDNIPHPRFYSAVESRFAEEELRDLRRESNSEYDLPRYGSSRQPSTPPPSNYEGVITESTVWHNITPPTPYSQEEEDHIEHERRLADMLLQETEKIRNTPILNPHKLNND